MSPTVFNSSSRGYNTVLAFSVPGIYMVCVCVHTYIDTCKQNTHAHKVKINLEKKNKKISLDQKISEGTLSPVLRDAHQSCADGRASLPSTAAQVSVPAWP